MIRWTPGHRASAKRFERSRTSLRAPLASNVNFTPRMIGSQLRPICLRRSGSFTARTLRAKSPIPLGRGARERRRVARGLAEETVLHRIRRCPLASGEGRKLAGGLYLALEDSSSARRGRLPLAEDPRQLHGLLRAARCGILVDLIHEVSRRQRTHLQGCGRHASPSHLAMVPSFQESSGRQDSQPSLGIARGLPRALLHEPENPDEDEQDDT